ncbi:MAG: cupin [Thermoleophilia bacterium]
MEDGQLPRRVDKPWGYELWFALSERYAGKLLHVMAGQRLSVQYHEEKDESSYLLSGRVRLHQGPTIDDLTAVELTAGAVWRNRPRQVHTIEALDDAVVVEVSTPELDDVVRLTDDYGRAGTAAP